MSYHWRRYKENSKNVPMGYFSILGELAVTLIRDLEMVGYELPSHLFPDISVGQLFSKYLRSKGYDVDSYPSYPHRYEDGRLVYPRAYPIKLLGESRVFYFKWLEDSAPKYFNTKPQGYDVLTTPDKFLALDTTKNYPRVEDIQKEVKRYMLKMNKTQVLSVVG